MDLLNYKEDKLAEKLRRIQYVGMSKEEFAKSFDADEVDMIEKAMKKFPVQKEEELEEEEVEKSEEPKKEAKVAKVMKEFKDGTLKSSSGELVTDRDQAIAIAMSEAGIEKGSGCGDKE